MWWPSQRMRTVSALVSLTVAMGVLAVMHDGTDVADVDLNDGGVWVTYLHMPGGRSVTAHLNYPSRTLDSYTEPPTSSFDVSQQANAVVLHDEQNDSVASVNTATWLTGPSASLPRGATATQGGDVVAIADPNQGKVWAVPASSTEQFSAQTPAVLDKALGVRAIVGVDGTIHTVTPDGKLRDITRAGASWKVKSVGDVSSIADGDDVSLTAVGDTGVVFDRSRGWVAWPDHHEVVDSAKQLLLQQPGDAGEAVALADGSRLVQVPMDGGDPAVREVPANGAPVAPVTVGSCTYAAWAGTGQFVRDCTDDAQDIDQHYAQLAKEGTQPDELVFRVNRDVVVLNDTFTGHVLLVNEKMALVNDWQNITAQMQDEDKKQNDAVKMTAFHRTKKNRPPKARNDSYGVRAGQTVSLPVLANDTDPDGDVLLASVDSASTELGQITAVRNGRALRIAVPNDRSGSATFRYIASDGRGGTAKATVHLQVHQASSNQPPVQIQGRSSELTMVQRGTAEHYMLGEWSDPDGDPFWVDHVRFPRGMDGTFRPDGLVRITDDGTQPPRTAKVVVSLTDGRAVTAATLTVRVRQRGVQLPPTANADFVQATVGQPVTVTPLKNDTDPNGDDLVLTDVKSDAGGTVKGDFRRGTFTYTPTKAEVRYLDYSISDGPDRASGVVRVDAEPPDAANAKPVPDADLVVLPPDGEATANVLDNDTDPLGGVLVLQSVNQADGVTAAVVDHETLKIESTGSAAGPVTLNYHVANKNGSSTGTVTVVPDRHVDRGTPIAYDDSATVRSGDIVTVEVMKNDVSPGDRELHVQPALTVTEGGALGTAFVADDKVRFKADGKSGTVKIKYTVLDPDQNASTGTLTIDIAPLSGSNAPPDPKPLTARLVQGGSTQLQVPLDGIDPDGDSATLLGLDRAPAKGVATVSGGVITYTAATGSDDVGTDSFTYLVEDRFGAQAVGRVDVGVASPAATDEPPLPTADAAVVRPGRLISVPVLDNDIDPEGEPLSLVKGSAAPADEHTHAPAHVVKGHVQVTTPDVSGVLRYRYGVADAGGNRATGYATVQVKKNAPLLAPVARDDVVPLAAIVGKTSVAVAVLDNDDDPDGAASTLVPSADTTGVEADSKGQLVVPLTPQRQVIVYSVTDQDGQVGRAAIIVPGTSSLAAQRPVVRADAPLPIKVKAGEQVSIPIADYVAVRTGRTATVPFTENIQPGPGWAGGQKLKDPKTLLFRSRKNFYGPTAVTFLASDADGKSDKDARTATLTLPIDVTANGSTPPSLVPPAIYVTPGEAPWTGDLRLQAHDPDPGDQAKLTFSVSDVPPDIHARIKDGHVLEVSADEKLKIDTSRQFQIEVSDGTHTTKVRATAKVVSSTRPLMSVRPAVIRDAKAGQPVHIDVADYVTNPFADEGGSLKLVGNPSVSGDGKVHVDGATTFSVTPGSDFHGTLGVTYVVADATNRPERQRQGQVTIEVQGKPDAPTGVIAVATKSHTVDVKWRAGANNGSPITHYRVEWSGGGSGSRTIGNQTALTVDGLTNNKEYTFTVVATNAVGDSDPSARSRPAKPDQVPDAPTGVSLSFRDSALDVSWARAHVDGSPVTKYEVWYGGQSLVTSGPVTHTRLTGLQNGRVYAVKVRAYNAAETESDGVQGAGAWSSSVSEHPNGVPDAPTSVSIDADGPDPDPSAVISWNPGSDNGEPASKYEVRKNGGSTVACTRLSETSCRVSLAEGDRARFSVRLFNRANPEAHIDGYGPWSASTDQVTGAKEPGPVGTPNVAATGSSGQARVTFADADEHGADDVTYHYAIAGGPAGTLHSGDVLSGFSDGQNRTIEVWAVTQANGKDSAPGPHKSATGNSFSPCTVDVQTQSENYDNVTFRWSVSSHGRPCAYSGNASGGDPQGQTTGSPSGSVNKGSGPHQNVSLTVTARTVRSGDDANVGNASDTASGNTWNPTIDWSEGPAGCTAFTNCHWASLQLTDFRPNSSVSCHIDGDGAGAWNRTFTVNGSGDHFEQKTWQYQKGGKYNPNMYDNQACTQR